MNTSSGALRVGQPEASQVNDIVKIAGQNLNDECIADGTEREKALICECGSKIKKAVDKRCR